MSRAVILLGDTELTWGDGAPVGTVIEHYIAPPSVTFFSAAPVAVGTELYHGSQLCVVRSWQAGTCLDEFGQTLHGYWVECAVRR
jgi:hypothetical protein